MIVSILDCQGKICKNGGIMEEGTCNCTCPNRTQIYGPNCDGNYYTLSEFFHKSNFSFFLSKKLNICFILFIFEINKKFL